MTDAAKPLVLISHQMLSPVQQPLEAAGYEVARRWELVPGQAERVRVIVHAGEIPLSHDFLEGLPQLGLIANVSVGYDGVDVPWCRARGIEVTHAKGLN
ncbi:MAG: 2-hydroxyacid dehydrogenase, partial [Phenylobacterium sp.]